MILESTLKSVGVIEERTLEFAREAGFAEDVAESLAMVAREAAANAIIHGNQYSGSKRVTVSFETTPQALTIKVSDEGGGVDVSAIRDPLAPENLLLSSGRGVFLMRTFMDEVHFRQLDPGTEITLVKRRRP